MSVCTAYLQSNRGVVSSFAKKNLIFCGFSTVVILVSNLGGVFRLSAMENFRVVMIFVVEFFFFL